MKSVEPSASILIVDDNDVSRAMLRFIVSSDARYRVVGEADSAMAGLDLIGRLRPALVCLDINMPDCSGLDLLRRIKSQWPDTAVLMVTGSDDHASLLAAVEGGASGYLVKPFDPHILLGTVAQALAGS